MSEMRSWGTIAAFLIAAMAAAVAPLLRWGNDAATAVGKDFPGWPRQYEGHALTQLPLTQREATFVRDFPGRVGRFTDGRREIIIRWVGAPTRLLHSAADCFRGSGYSIAPMPVRRDIAGAAMGCFRASHQADRLMVCEVIRDARGESWPDVSAWYWNAMLSVSAAPWWSFVVAESE
ncbi:MAG TPA: hypothetical protein VIY51_07090 [Xanthobacteraceae bacterium]